MKQVFESHNLGGIQLRNRLVRSATFEHGGAENGILTPFLKEVYGALAKGQVGLIITGMMSIGPNAGIGADMTKIYDDSFVGKFSGIVQAVHENGGKIVVQLGHCGAKAAVIDYGDQPFAPSEYKKAKEISREEMAMLVKYYGMAAARCHAAGADGVQIHGAHGYLVSEFLSPFFNKRSDEYGGGIENRARFLFEVYEEIRLAVGADYPVFIKINYEDLVEGGLNGAECAWVCAELERRGIDAIEVSSGISVSRESSSVQGPQAGPCFFSAGGLDIANQVNVPVFSVGGYRTVVEMVTKLNQGNLTAISLCRPFIREPDLAARWMAGDTTASTCISCSKCFGMERLGCVLEQA